MSGETPGQVAEQVLNLAPVLTPALIELGKTVLGLIERAVASPQEQHAAIQQEAVDAFAAFQEKTAGLAQALADDDAAADKEAGEPPPAA